jgi:hypothetical protein
MHTCPKCGHAQQDPKACHRCGLHFARARAGRVVFPTDPLEGHPLKPVLTERWLVLSRALDDTTAHHAFIELCAAQNALDFAGQAYRQLTPPGEVEDPRVAALRGRVLKCAVARAAATLGAGRPADKVERQARVARSFTLLMASLIVLTFAAGYWVLSRAPMP